MNTYSEEPDGFILYDERPDPFDNRRASRTRFAAVNLPILLGISAVSALLLWITQSCLGQCGINRQVGGAVHVFAIALYGLLHYQSTWLEKRCNDAGKGHYPAIWMFRISLVLAAISLILPVFTLPMVAGGLLQFVAYGRRRTASIRLRHDIAVQPAAQSDGLPQSQLDSPANLRALSVYHGSVDGCRIVALVLSISQ